VTVKELLVVVDYQNDFVNGALGFEGAETLEPGIVQAVEQTLAEGGFVLFTRDTHPASYHETREGRFLPIAHCVEGSTGHQLFGRLHAYEEAPHARVAVANKPNFGLADIGQRAVALCGGAPDVVRLCGLVTDICVVTNAMLLHSALPEAEVGVLEGLVGSGNQKNAEAALSLLAGMGIERIAL
jgi:nicotinamidase-related amidase